MSYSLTGAQLAKQYPDMPLVKATEGKEFLVSIYFSPEPRTSLYDENGGLIGNVDFMKNQHVMRTLLYKDGKNPAENMFTRDRAKKQVESGYFDKTIFINCSNVRITYDQSAPPNEEDMMKMLRQAIRSLKSFLDIQSARGYYGNPVKVSVGAEVSMMPLLLAMSDILGKRNYIEKFTPGTCGSQPFNEAKNTYKAFLSRAHSELGDTLIYYKSFNWTFNVIYNYVVQTNIVEISVPEEPEVIKEFRFYEDILEEHEAWMIKYGKASGVVKADGRAIIQSPQLVEETLSKVRVLGNPCKSEDRMRQLMYIKEDAFWQGSKGDLLHYYEMVQVDNFRSYPVDAFIPVSLCQENYKALLEVNNPLLNDYLKMRNEEQISLWKREYGGAVGNVWEDIKEAKEEVVRKDQEYQDIMRQYKPIMTDMKALLEQIEGQNKNDGNEYEKAYYQGAALRLVEDDGVEQGNIYQADYQGEQMDTLGATVTALEASFKIAEADGARKRAIKNLQKKQREYNKLKNWWIYRAVKEGVGIASIVFSPLALVDLGCEIFEIVYDLVSGDGFDPIHLVNIGCDVISLIPVFGGMVGKGVKAGVKAARAGAKAVGAGVANLGRKITGKMAQKYAEQLEKATLKSLKTAAETGVKLDAKLVPTLFGGNRFALAKKMQKEMTEAVENFLNNNQALKDIQARLMETIKGFKESGAERQKIINKFIEGMDNFNKEFNGIDTGKYFDFWVKSNKYQQDLIETLAKNIQANIDDAVRLANADKSALLNSLKGELQKSALQGIESQIKRTTKQEAKEVLKKTAEETTKKLSAGEWTVKTFKDGIEGLAKKGRFTTGVPYYLFHPSSIADDVLELSAAKELSTGVYFLLDWGATVYTVNSLANGGISLVNDYQFFVDDGRYRRY